MLSLEEWQSAIRSNVPNDWTIFVVYLDIWPMKRLRRGQLLFWVARYFLICDDKTMAFAAQQDKSFDNSPLKGCGSPPQVVSPTATTSESPCNPIGRSFATSAETVIRITGTKPESPCNLIGRSLLRVLR